MLRRGAFGVVLARLAHRLLQKQLCGAHVPCSEGVSGQLKG